MEAHHQKKLEALQLKCDNILSFFKKRRRDDYLMNINTGYYDDKINKVKYIRERVSEKLREIYLKRDTAVVDALFDEYNMENSLIESLQMEFENIDKEVWYDENFDGWEPMPDRQDCDSYPIHTRLEYSRQRREMFDHLERKFKLKTFGPNLADRLEFF
jgi:hypothetical protein